MSFTRKLITGALALTCVIALAACDSGTTGKQADAVNNDQQSSADALVQLQAAQPTPAFQYSQLRQTVIDIEKAQAGTTQTTTFFFNQGVANPVDTCPSIGFPVPATDQLTNPQQIIRDRGDRNGGNIAIPQVDPTGVYSGDTAGTYVLCVDGQGKAYANYWEGFVKTVSGPAVWDAKSGTVQLTGPSSFDFSVGQK